MMNISSTLVQITVFLAILIATLLPLNPKPYTEPTDWALP